MFKNAIDILKPSFECVSRELYKNKYLVGGMCGMSYVAIMDPTNPTGAPVENPNAPSFQQDFSCVQALRWCLAGASRLSPIRLNIAVLPHKSGNLKIMGDHHVEYLSILHEECQNPALRQLHSLPETAGVLPCRVSRNPRQALFRGISFWEATCDLAWVTSGDMSYATSASIGGSQSLLKPAKGECPPQLHPRVGTLKRCPKSEGSPYDSTRGILGQNLAMGRS